MSKQMLNVYNSERLYAEALKVLPMGTSSNARLWKGVCPAYMPCSLFMKRGRGSHIWDVDDNEYIDYRLGFGPVILGHAYPKCHDRVHEIDENGLIFAFSHQIELEVAKKICEMVPSAEMTRFCNSGTEATMHALRVARAYTGREKIIKFEGQYHGAHDYVLFDIAPDFKAVRNKTGPIPASTGIPRAIADLVITIPWNDFEALEKTVKEKGNEIAAVITEPVLGNCCAITPRKGYLEHLKKICSDHNIVLIFDEVKTGFRLSSGGAQKLYGVTPDMTAMAKSLGNGYPVAAFGGKKEIMEGIGPDRVIHGGTYSGNPISLAAAKATLEILENEPVYAHLEKFGRKLMAGISDILTDAKLSFHLLGHPAMFQFVFSERDGIYQYRDLEDADFDLYGKIHYELLKNGVMIDQDNEEVWFTSYSHTDEDAEKTLEAVRAATRAVKPSHST